MADLQARPERISRIENATQQSHKRKREADPTEDGNASVKQPKKAKKKKNGKKPEAEPVKINESAINPLIAHMDSTLLSDHIAQRTKRFQPDLSVVEADDLHIPASRIRDTSSFSEDRSLANLPTFLQQFSSRPNKPNPRLGRAAKENSSPHTLLVAGAGLRAADITRALRQFQNKDCMVAKLFAKHIKLHEATEMVKTTRMGIGIGTPQRLLDLLDNGSLKINQLDRIVVDASQINEKKQGILDIKEVQIQLLAFLNRPDIRERLTGDRSATDLMFY